MTPNDIAMCVADSLSNDVECVETVLSFLNIAEPPSWRHSRGEAFTGDEVVAALRELLKAGLISPYAQVTRGGGLEQIAARQVDAEFPIESVWFQLQPAGRAAEHQWWESVGKFKYPVAEEV